MNKQCKFYLHSAIRVKEEEEECSISRRNMILFEGKMTCEQICKHSMKTSTYRLAIHFMQPKFKIQPTGNKN